MTKLLLIIAGIAFIVLLYLKIIYEIMWRLFKKEFDELIKMLKEI